MTTETTVPVETRRFEAEVEQVLNLVTHSLYSHKEIFLRELISNASDACDKLRFEAIANPALAGADGEFAIRIDIDREARTLGISDNGIGMSRDEVIDNIGTVARSGTRRFLDSLSGDARKDSALIGQFGVGFYSAFVVADRVTLSTRRAGADAEQGVRWESTGTGEYTVEAATLSERGTRITLHFKPGEDEFLEPWRVRSLIAKYSDHIAFPIRMAKPDLDAENGEAAESAANPEFETINHASALWARPKAELTDADYQGFYKHIAHAYDEALAWTHNRVEGKQSYTSLLYLPTQAPFDLLSSGREERRGLKLYIRRVFIMDASEQLLPAYLRFVRGVVDSDDLPLNVSREILQENRLVQQIRAGLGKRVLDLLDSLAAEQPEKFQTFYQAFGQVLKEGVVEDHGNRERVAKLLRFASTRGEGAKPTVSLDDYIGRMAEGEDTIWYVTADSYAAAAGSPQLEALKARGTEVLLWCDRIDEWVAGHLNEYAGKKLRNVAKGEFKLDEAAAKQHAEAEQSAAPLTTRIKALLGEKVREVRVSARLTESPACLVQDEYEMALHMQQLLRAAGQAVPESAPILEINPAHALVQRLANSADDAVAGELALVLLDQARLAAGGQLDDPAAFLRRINTLLA